MNNSYVPKFSLKNKKIPEQKTGTTIIAVQFEGGVVIGADSRATTGSYIANRITDKIMPLDKKIYCCRSGSSADTQAVADYVKLYLSIHSGEIKTLPRVKTCANLIKELCYKNKNYLMASMICAGWDDTDGGSIYAIPLGGSLVKSPYALGGSGSVFIYGYCESNFRENFSKEEAINFVVKALTLAMNKDGSSGGLIRYAIITKDGVDKQKIIPKNFPTFPEKK